MDAHPLVVRDDMRAVEAGRFLVAKGFSAVPVVDAGGKPVGVLSQTDLLAQERDRPRLLTEVLRFYEQHDLADGAKSRETRRFHFRNGDTTLVRQVMTPVVFSVSQDMPARLVVDHLLTINVQRLFVVDELGMLVGVVSAHDILRRLREEPQARNGDQHHTARAKG